MTIRYHITFSKQGLNFEPMKKASDHVSSLFMAYLLFEYAERLNEGMPATIKDLSKI